MNLLNIFLTNMSLTSTYVVMFCSSVVISLAFLKLYFFVSSSVSLFSVHIFGNHCSKTSSKKNLQYSFLRIDFTTFFPHILVNCNITKINHRSTTKVLKFLYFGHRRSWGGANWDSRLYRYSKGKPNKFWMVLPFNSQ